MRKYSKRMVQACRDTVREYRKLIRNPEKNASKWDRYGNPGACRLCRASVAPGSRVNLETVDCDKCPFGNYAKAHGEISSCGCVAHTDKMHTTYDDLYDAIRDWLGFGNKHCARVSKAAKARLAVLLAAFRQQGINLSSGFGKKPVEEKKKTKKHGAHK